MSLLNNHIASVQNKLQQLLRQYELLQKENEKQQQQIVQLQNEKAAAGEQLEVLQQQNLVLKSSINEMSPVEKKELEQKLNQYIKNIDKCISVLSQ